MSKCVVGYQSMATRELCLMIANYRISLDTSKRWCLHRFDIFVDEREDKGVDEVKLVGVTTYAPYDGGDDGLMKQYMKLNEPFFAGV